MSAEKQITKPLDMDEECTGRLLDQRMKELLKALFVCSTWCKDLDRVAIVNQCLATLLAQQQIPTYSTTLEVRDHKITADESTGVSLVSPDNSIVKRLVNNKTPVIDWLYASHASYYPHLSTGISSIGLVVGHLALGENGHLVNAGLTIKKEIAGEAKFFMVNHEIPEDFGDCALERNAYEVAGKADVIFSVGPHVYEHYNTKYKPLKSVEHFCYYPEINNLFSQTKIESPCKKDKKQILTICNVNSEDDFSRYDVVAMAMGKVGKQFHGVYETVPVWVLYGVKESVREAFTKYLTDKSKCGSLNIPAPYASVSLADLQKAMHQSALLLAPEKKDPFNFAAYLAMQAGLPTLVPSCSGIKVFLDRLFPIDDYSSYCSVDTGFYANTADKDSDNWSEKIIQRINSRTCDISFKKAEGIRKKLIDHPEIKKSQQLFVEKCLEVLECENYDTVSDSGGCEVRQPVKRQRYVSKSTAEYMKSSTRKEHNIDLRRASLPPVLSESMMSQGSVWSAKLKQLIDYPDEKCTVILSTSLGPIKICEKDFLISHGSAGTMVYLGFDKRNGTGVAVKCMVKSGRMIQCIQREHIMINNRDLMAENIVKCYGVVETDNYVYIIQELCEKTLGQHIEDLKRQKRVQLEAKKMITEICTGLKVLHSSNPQIVHRDLKPENVLIDHHGVAKITDFGICHPVYDSSSSFMTGAAGSLCWQAQEELPNVADDTVDDDDDDDYEDDDDGLGHDNGGDSHNKAKDTFEGNKVHCSHRSDIQVMGMLIAFILSGGKHPFGKMENPFVVMENIRKGQFKLKNINNVIAKHLVGWMLEKERQDRPSIDEVLRHPYFWEVSTCLSFLVAIATELQNSDRSLHGLSEDVNENWINRAGQGPFQRMLNHEYSGTVEEFLAFTKSCNEYQNSATADTIEADVGEYILGDFPDMFIRIYCAIHETRKCVDADNWTVKGRVKPFFLT